MPRSATESSSSSLRSTPKFTKTKSQVLSSAPLLICMLAASTLLSSCLYFHRTMLSDTTGMLNKLHTNSMSLPLPGVMQVWFVRSAKDHMDVVAVKRKNNGQNSVELAVRELLEGPSREEIAHGLGSEIPRGTILLGVKQEHGKVELNLSRRFATDGGIDSFETRLAQLAKTVSAVADKKAVYLDVEGHRLTTTPGEGIEVRQPISN